MRASKEAASERPRLRLRKRTTRRLLALGVFAASLQAQTAYVATVEKFALNGRIPPTFNLSIVGNSILNFSGVGSFTTASQSWLLSSPITITFSIQATLTVPAVSGGGTLHLLKPHPNTYDPSYDNPAGCTYPSDINQRFKARDVIPIHVTMLCIVTRQPRDPYQF